MDNPIQSVNGVAIKCPSSFTYQLQDVSAADSGRTEDGLMHKNRIGQVKGLQLAWQNITTQEVTAILQAFNAEYFNVRYFDPLQGGYVTENFYCGDRSAPMYSALLDRWSNLSFNIIKRSVK